MIDWHTQRYGTLMLADSDEQFSQEQVETLQVHMTLHPKPLTLDPRPSTLNPRP